MKRVPISKLAYLLPLVAAVGATGACQGEVSGPPNLAIRTAELARAQNCDDLLNRLRQDALYKSDLQLDAQIYMVERYYEDDDEGGFWGAWGFGDSAASADKGGNEAPSQSDGSGGGTGTGTGSSSSGGPNGAPDHSETNTQVAGVDEADIVKTDGNYLYVLHGQQLATVAAWPVTDLGIAGNVAIEGQPLEMFVVDDKVVVYSAVDATGIYQAAGVSPPTYSDPYGGYYEGDAYYGPQQMTKTTVLRFDGSTTEVLRELYFEGSYASSRRIDNHVRTVFNGIANGPQLRFWTEDYYGNDDKNEMIASYEALRLYNRLIIAGTSLDTFISRRFERVGSQIQEQAPSCSDYYVPSSGSTAAGMTYIEAIDLDHVEGEVQQTSVVGMANIVYSSHDALYVAGLGWNAMSSYYSALSVMPLATEATHIHKFDIVSDPARPTYVASGSVGGSLHDQFSLDEHEGVLRVAVTATMVSERSWDTANHLFTMDGSLDLMGAVRGLAPGEQIYSARFVGDRGYVVTFRQVDPLFTFDLSNPAKPKLLGELKIPGFSTYMHPLEDGYLLTIGQSDDWGNVALQIFDVTTPTDPKLIHKHVLPEGSSEAEYSHKAFTFYEGMLAIPFSSWSGYASSTLELFDIDLVDGITPIGSIDHTSFFESMTEQDYYCSYYGGQVRRGVFIDDYIYSVSEGGVLVNDLTQDLDLVASLALPELGYGDCNYGY